jgi:hypothetical protein
MGHRALVAYRQSDETFTLRYAHWGQNLAAAIGPATPLGGLAEGPDAAATAERLGVERYDGDDPAVPTRVAPRPLATGVTAADVLGALGPSYESLVVVPPSFEATTYLVCSLNPDGAGADPVLARPADDPESLRSWFVEAKSRLSEAVARGDLSREVARATLRRALAARAALVPADDASFLRDR